MRFSQASDLGGSVLQVDDTRLNHLMVQVVSLTSTLAHTGKHRVATMGLGHVVDQLHNQDSLADTSATKQTCRSEEEDYRITIGKKISSFIIGNKQRMKGTLTDFASLGIRGQQVNHLNASHQDLLLYTHVCEFRGFSVNWCRPGRHFGGKKTPHFQLHELIHLRMKI